MPFLSWLYFPLRAEAVGLPRLATLDGFLEHVLARGFAGDMFAFANPSALPGRLSIFANVLTFEFTWPLLALLALGLAAALRREIGAVLLAAVGLHVFVAITYRAPQTVEYLMPAYVLAAVAAGMGLAGLWRWGQAWLAGRLPAGGRIASGLALLALAAAIGAQFAATVPSYLARARDGSTRDYAAALLRDAPPGAVILSAWHWATPLWYLQQMEGQRPDVEVQYVFPSGDSLARNWVEAIGDRLDERPVVVTNYYRGEYAALAYRFVPLGPAWQVLAMPLTEAPAGLAGGRQFGELAFLGYEIEQGTGWPRRVRAAWRVDGQPEDVSFFIHLVGPDGQLHSQQDLSHPAGSYAAGEVLLDRYTLAVRPDAAPGDYQLVAGAYRPDGTRLAEVQLTTLPLDETAMATVDGEAGAVPFGGDVWLTGWQARPAGPLQPGQELRVKLNFMAARPLSADYVVGVSLAGDGWRAQSDGIPAGGAIPTLKWIAGSRINDSHTLVVPANAAPGPAQLTLTLYDFFTQEPLGVLEPELAALGPGLALGTVDIVAP